MKKHPFNHKLASECAKAFNVSTGLGCTVSDLSGNILTEYGCGYGCCPVCQAAGLAKESGIHAHNYGLAEAERFGGKYIYFCPLGLTFMVSPIIGETRSMAKITAGPFLMVELQDYIDYELTENLHFDSEVIKKILPLIANIPFIEPAKARELSNLLFMAVGFMNNVSAEYNLLKRESAELLQGQISSYITELKHQSNPSRYPFEKESSLLQAISRHNSTDAEHQVQEYLAALFTNSGGDLDWIKARISEMTVLASRAAVEQGASEKQILIFLQSCQKQLATQQNFSALSTWLLDTVLRFINEMAVDPDIKHANIIHRCIQHISTRYTEHLTLEEMASIISFSPDYLSRIFRQETGITFNQYVNHVRIAKAKELIRHSDLRLTDISQMTGFDDQSYFTKVFRRMEGMSPREYAKKCHSQSEEVH
ncbi:MAG: helix-turn-helix domain-containing protein [Lachnospiraceae bacterium]|nr:helix-turn-helix domain-containing protein [Lachnospiraceae bacterium]